MTVLLLLCAVGCESKPNEDSLESYKEDVVADDELTSLLGSDEISNSEKGEILQKLTDEELKRAEKYKTMIVDEYEKRIEEFSLYYENINFDIKSATESVYNYCEYLKNEYENNAEFFDNYAVIKYNSGTSGSIWKARRYYESAKTYADKMQELYENLI